MKGLIGMDHISLVFCVIVSWQWSERSRPGLLSTLVYEKDGYNKF